ncbi:hypothetical protein DFP72DRAFT_851557, partial [Ephemerocybe angulata]
MEAQQFITSTTANACPTPIQLPFHPLPTMLSAQIEGKEAPKMSGETSETADHRRIEASEEVVRSWTSNDGTGEGRQEERLKKGGDEGGRKDESETAHHPGNEDERGTSFEVIFERRRPERAMRRAQPGRAQRQPGRGQQEGGGGRVRGQRGARRRTSSRKEAEQRADANEGEIGSLDQGRGEREWRKGGVDIEMGAVGQGRRTRAEKARAAVEVVKDVDRVGVGAALKNEVRGTQANDEGHAVDGAETPGTSGATGSKSAGAPEGERNGGPDRPVDPKERARVQARVENRPMGQKGEQKWRPHRAKAARGTESTKSGRTGRRQSAKARAKVQLGVQGLFGLGKRAPSHFEEPFLYI